MLVEHVIILNFYTKNYYSQTVLNKIYILFHNKSFHYDRFDVQVTPKVAEGASNKKRQGIYTEHGSDGA